MTASADDVAYGTLIDRLRSHAAGRPDKVVTRHLLPDGCRELTFAAFVQRAEQFACSFAAEGLGRGGVALIFLPTSPDALPAFVGAMMLGAIPSFMPCPSAKQHPESHWESHRRLLDRIAPRLLVTDLAHRADMHAHGLANGSRTLVTIDEVPTATPPGPATDIGIAPGDIAFLQHSSGTTALKKGVALSHRAILAQIDAYAATLEIEPDHNIVSWLPIYHDMGLIACSVLPLLCGQTVTILDPFQWTARPAALLEAIDRFDGHYCWLPNFAFEHLCRAVPRTVTADLSRMRAFINCSEPCKAVTFARFLERFGPLGVRRFQLKVCYAMAETVFAVTQTGPRRSAKIVEVDPERLHADAVAIDPGANASALPLLSAGAVLPGVSLEIRENGEVLGDDRVGEIVVSGNILFDGYLDDPAATSERLQDRRYFTRDRGFTRAGELFVLGRSDDLLIINGRNLHAHEVEAIAAETPSLKAGRAAAFGVFSERIGSEELVVVAERDPAASIAERAVMRALRDAIFEQTGIEAAHVGIVQPGWIVKTTSGKIGRGANRRKWLDERELTALHSVASPPAR